MKKSSRRGDVILYFIAELNLGHTSTLETTCSLSR